MGLTLKRLIECYRTDCDSDFLGLKHQVRLDHERILARLSKAYGGQQLRSVRLRDLKAWYREWVAEGKVSMARSFVDRLRESLRFGATILEDRECQRLFAAIDDLRLERSPARSVQLTAEQARQIRLTARNHFFWPSIALAQALQFELRLSQKDVIGEWLPESVPGETDVVSEKYGKWFRGIRWEGLDENLILHHRAGAGGRLIKADLNTAPMVLEELKERFNSPHLERAMLPHTGPVVVCDTSGWPWTTAEYRRKWRMVARKAGVPEHVTNRDSAPVVGGGSDRAKISEQYHPKRLEYVVKVQRRMRQG
jgi:hypothetical protein